MDKPFVESRLGLMNVRIVGIIYNGLLFGVSKRQIMQKIKKQVYRASKTYGLNRNEAKYVWTNAYDAYNRMYKGSFGALQKLKNWKSDANRDTIISSRASIVYNYAQKELIVDKTLQKATNRVLNSMEQRDKFASLQHTLSGETDYTPFFLCSWHSDSAPDHKDFQGKMYYDENYAEKLRGDPELLDRARAYIKNRGLKKLQWVISAPVYMTTRPNCRHFFTPVPCPEALSSGIPALLKRYGLRIHPEEDGGVKVRSAMSDAERAHRAYLSRYQTHKAMWRIMPNDDLAEDMKKDRQLIKKWRKAAMAQE